MKAVNNGFWARYLDADDLDFLEYVKKRGVANGDVQSTTSVLLEELEFWRTPYTVAPDVVRRIGRPPRSPNVETPEQRELRLARTSAWHARRALRRAEKEIADKELERERIEWEVADKRRRLRDLIGDREWDEAAPVKRAFGKTHKRHYVPQWKLDEEGVEKYETNDERYARLNRNERFARAKAEAESRLAEAEKAKAELHAQTEAATGKANEQSEAAIKQAKETIDHALRYALELGPNFGKPVIYPDNDTLKRAILKLIEGTAPYVWTEGRICNSLGCHDVDRIRVCVKELLDEHKLRTAAV